MADIEGDRLNIATGGDGGSAMDDFIRETMGSASAPDETLTPERTETVVDTAPEGGDASGKAVQDDAETGTESAAETEAPEAEPPAGPEFSFDGKYLAQILKYCADNGIQLPADPGAAQGDAAPATQVDSRNAISEDSAAEPFELAQEELDALCIDQEAGKKLSPLFDRLQERMFTQVQKSVAKMVGQAQAQLFGPLYVAQQFYDQHPEMEAEYGPVVNQAISLVKARHPEYTNRQVMAEVSVMVDPLVAKVNTVAKQLDAANRGKSTGTRAPSTRPSAPSSPKPQTATEAAIAGLSGNTKTDPALRKLGYI